jgi:hypothetical protein
MHRAPQRAAKESRRAATSQALHTMQAEHAEPDPAQVAATQRCETSPEAAVPLEQRMHAPAAHTSGSRRAVAAASPAILIALLRCVASRRPLLASGAAIDRARPRDMDLWGGFKRRGNEGRGVSERA